MTIEQAAAFLQLSRETLYKYAQSGRIPAIKVGRHWRFKQETIESFLDRGPGVRDSVKLSESPQTGSPAQSQESGRRFSILVVDDDVSMLKLIGAWITMAGHQVATAGSGRQAMELLQGNTYDAIFLDLHLGDVNGDEVLDALPQPVQTAVVLITGDPGSATMDRALKHPVTYALTKPFSEDDISRILNLLARK